MVLKKYSTLKEKDFDYLRFILKHGCVTAKQVMSYFEEPNIDRVYRRLRKLSDRGYVKNEKLALSLGVFLCTHEARDLLEMEVTVPTKVSLYTAQHDLLLNDLIIYLVKSLRQTGNQFSYKSERELRFEYIKEEDSSEEKLKKLNEVKETIPDAIFYANGNVISIELELSKKEKNRYREKFRYFDNLIKEGKYSEIWYFVDSKKVENALIAAREEVMINKNKLKINQLPKAVKGAE